MFSLYICHVLARFPRGFHARVPRPKRLVSYVCDVLRLGCPPSS